MEEFYEEHINKLQDFADYLSGIEDRHNELVAEYRQLNFLNTDVRHLLELGKIDAIDMMKISSVYRKKLKRRREVSNKKDVWLELRDFFERNSKLIKQLEDVVKNIRSLKREKNKAQYYAKSKFGQKLIDEFSEEEDDLIQSVKEEDLYKLKEHFNN